MLSLTYTKKTVSAKGRDTNPSSFLQFLQSQSTANLRLPSVAGIDDSRPKTFLPLGRETSLAVAIDSQPTIASCGRSTTHSRNPLNLSLAVAIGSDLQLPLWPELTLVRFTAENPSLLQLQLTVTYNCLHGQNQPSYDSRSQSTANLRLPPVAEIDICMIYSRK